MDEESTFKNGGKDVLLLSRRAFVIICRPKCGITYLVKFMCNKRDNDEFTLQRWHRSASEVAFRCLYTLMLLRGGINPFSYISVIHILMD